jgi:protease-4
LVASQGHHEKLVSDTYVIRLVFFGLRVFRESHRRHHEPNLKYETQVIPRTESKPLYAFSDSFSSLGDPANKEYYLASIFTDIHLQKNGELNLFGMVSQGFFIRDFLVKYGVSVHVFKHGIYKNFPNMFTESKFNRAHLENVTNILQDLDASTCDEITRSRSEALLTSWLKNNQKHKKSDDLWKRIHESGTFPALTAWKAGLIDYLPRRDPLTDLLESNQKEGEERESIQSGWDRQETDFDKFKAAKPIQLKDYAKRISKKQNAKNRKMHWNDYAKSQPSLIMLLSMMGLAEDSSTTSTDDKPREEKVALLYAHAEGGINDSTAQKLVKSIRNIRKDKDVKAVVLRVSSPGGAITPCETIREELKSLGIPVVVSFGNVSASGGYYISSAADRIFASHKTVTGSIGVFGIRMDLINLAKQYGINVQHVATGDLAATYDPFHPMTRKMGKQFGDSIDRFYAHFKSIVADGRNLSLDQVECVAKGRVWTGKQAKANGLVDELGGLHRAIAYAKRTYTTTGDAEVVVWPRKLSYLARLSEAVEQNDASMIWSTLAEWAAGVKEQPRVSTSSENGLVDWILRSSSSKGLPGTLSGVLLTADENTAIRCLLSELDDSPMPDDTFPSFFWD